MKFTVLGGSGFIGSSLVTYLRSIGHEVQVPTRNMVQMIGKEMGNVIYAIGLTGNFRGKPFETVEAHVGLLSTLLRDSNFDSWLYLSSTRLYNANNIIKSTDENTTLSVKHNCDSIYDISKIMGESLCLSHSSPKVRVARLSNVCGEGQSKYTFIGSLIQELQHNKSITIHESSASEKDYIALMDVIILLEKIILYGRERIYNVASGKNLTHTEVAKALTKLTGGSIIFKNNSNIRKFPVIDISRIKAEFNFRPIPMISFIENMKFESFKLKD